MIIYKDFERIDIFSMSAFDQGEIFEDPDQDFLITIAEMAIHKTDDGEYHSYKKAIDDLICQLTPPPTMTIGDIIIQFHNIAFEIRKIVKNELGDDYYKNGYITNQKRIL